MNKTLRVLVVEDSEEDVLLLDRQLRRDGYEPTVRRVDNAAAMSAALAEQEWDVVISDYHLPSFSGLEALSLLQTRGLDTPFVVVSGRIDEDTAVAAMRSGAHDYIMKHNLKRLGPAIRRELEEAENRRQRREAEEKVRRSELLYRLLAENAADVIWTTGTDLRLTYVSPSVINLLGYTSTEVMELAPEKILDPASLQAAKKLLSFDVKEAGNRAAGGTFEFQAVRKDGSPVWTETRISPLLDRGGKPGGLLGVTRDIGERKRVEMTLLDYQERLRSLASKLVLAEEQERRRIAMDLHDRASQTLAFCTMRLGTVKKSAPANMLAALEEIHDLLRQLSVETRTLTFELSPPVLYDIGLEAALVELAGKMEQKYGLPFAVRVSGKVRSLSNDLRVLLFQATRELMTNVAKHARAQKAGVDVSYGHDELRVAVKDDGVGFDTGLLSRSSVTSGFGLFSIRERLYHVGGRLEAESSSAAGTQIALIVPLTGM